MSTFPMVEGFVIGDRPLLGPREIHPPCIRAHGTCGPVTAVLASAIGRLHQAHDRPREDAATVRASGRWIAVGVSDGVGSRPHSRFAASWTADTLSRELIEQVTVPEKPTPSASPGSTPATPTPAAAIPPAKTHPAGFAPERPRPSRKPLRLMLPPALALRLDRSGRMMWVCRQRIRRWLGRRRLFPPLWQRFLLRWWRPWVNDSPAPPSWRSAATDAWWLSPANPARVAETSPAAQPSGPETDPACDPGPNLCEIMRRSFDAAHRHLHHQAATLGLDPAGLSCTALALLLDCETGELVAGQVGDGAILALSASGEVRELVSPPETGDAQTTFTLNAPDYAATLAVAQVHPAKCDPVEALFVMTDGLAGDLLYSAEPGALNTWARQVHHNLRHSPTPAAAAAGMLNWLAGYHVPGSWDDRTLVVLTLDHPAHAHRPTR